MPRGRIRLSRGSRHCRKRCRYRSRSPRFRPGRNARRSRAWDNWFRSCNTARITPIALPRARRRPNSHRPSPSPRPSCGLTPPAGGSKQLPAIDSCRFWRRPGIGFPTLWHRGSRTRACVVSASTACARERQVNTHVDIIAWRTDRAFVGEEQALSAATTHLAAKRMRAADVDEATGWLTHHAVHDENAWAFLERLFESTRSLPAVVWRRPEELFNNS